MKHCLTISKRAFSIGLLLLVTFFVSAQEAVYKNGVRQGVVNVKFEPGMDNTLKSAKITTKSNRLSTGIENFDKVASSVKATNMRRMFPDTPQNAAKLRKHGLHLWYAIEIDNSIDPRQAAASLKGMKEISAASHSSEIVLPPHQAVKYTPTTAKALNELPLNDPYLKDQWHYNNVGQRGLPDVQDVNLFEAWKLTKGRSDIIVSVHDAGIDVNHEDLKGNMWVNTKETAGNGKDDDLNGYADDINGWNFVYNMATMVPSDHGTHVAGTIAAMNDNGIGVSGIAGGTGKGDGVKIMALQIVGASSEEMAKSFIYAADHGAVISQNSWSYSNYNFYDPTLLDAIQYFITEAGDYEGSPMKGGIVIFASGNDGRDGILYPPYLDYVFTVNSLGPDGKLAKYSNYGTWTNICAPGGNSKTVNNGFGPAAGVLSTLAGNEYGYMDGTSMACPHVSGIAALILANSPQQITNDMLWKRLANAGRDIDDRHIGFDPEKPYEYVGKLGTGAIDALIAVQNDLKIAPNRILDLSVKTFNETSATLEWTIPEDQDNIRPEYYTIYYSRSAITNSNFQNAYKVKVENVGEPGEKLTAVVNDLVGNTTYYFAITSTDIWENRSDLSNIISGKSNIYADISVNTGNPSNNITLSADVATSNTASSTFQILNNSAGILNWKYSMRNTGSSIAKSALENSSNPIVDIQSAQYKYNLGGERSAIGLLRAEDNAAKTKIAPFSSYPKAYTAVTSQGAFIGDNDTSIPISGAVKFVVNEEAGFNLTKVEFYLTYKAGSGTIRLDVYNGDLDSKNIIYTQHVNSAVDINRGLVNISLEEQLYFEKGSEFYVVLHVPKGNLYPLRVDKELASIYSTYCYYSSSQGAEWVLLEQALYSYYGPLSPTYAWCINAITESPHTGGYLTLDPASGTVNGNSDVTVNLTADATYLVNGTYKTNAILTSNSPSNEELRVPVSFTVSGHKPKIVYPTIARFGEHFIESDTIIDIVLENQGYGLIKDLTASLSGSPAFTLENAPDNIAARNIASYRIKFKPTTEGSSSGTLTVTNGSESFSVSLYGLGKGVPKAVLDPDIQTISNITIGENVEATIAIKNDGAYPLEYFVPGYDQRGISNNWPDKYNKYGYIVKSNHPDVTEDTSLAYDFVDISATGVNITSQFAGANVYATVPIECKFPYYNTLQETIYVTRSGYTTFDNSKEMPSMNRPGLGEKAYPKGFISLFGFSYTEIDNLGKIYYQNEPDRLIIQYENTIVGDSPSTSQMVLFANGNIRFYYKDFPAADDWMTKYMSIFIEDIDQKDGILIRDDLDSDFHITSGTAIGFDYPGIPGVVTALENASGSVSPGQSATVKVRLKTDLLAEGQTDRYVNFITNDPKNKNINGLIKLDVVNGGTKSYSISAHDVDFGVIYKDVDSKEVVKIWNTGTKAMAISSLAYDNTKYTISAHMNIEPKQFSNIVIIPNTTNVAQLDDVLTITFADGTQEVINLKADVKMAPIAKADLSLVERTMSTTDKVSVPFTIENDGSADLEYTVLGRPELIFEESPVNTTDQYSYEYTKYDSGESVYSWIDIIGTGTKLDDLNKIASVWSGDIDLPFGFDFYGVEYSKIKINGWGIIAFDGSPAPFIGMTMRMPVNDLNSGYIGVAFGTNVFNNSMYGGLTGVYYQAFDDKFVISWEYITNGGGGGNMSSQILLFKDGSFKTQYKVRGEQDGISNRVTLGVQEKGKRAAIVAHERYYMDHGKGLAYFFTPANKKTLAPGQSVAGTIHIDPSRVYGGVLQDTLYVKTNDPLNPVLKKPFELTITGDPVVDIDESDVDFGYREVVIDKNTGYVSYTVPLNLVNTGTAPFIISDGKMEKGDQPLTFKMFVPYGTRVNKWMTVDEYFDSNDELVVRPGKGNVVEANITFTPVASGEFEDVLILNTSFGEKRIKITGKVAKDESPVLNVSTVPIEFSFDNLAVTETRNVPFDNIQGLLDLEYKASIKYTRYASEPHIKSAVEKENIGNAISSDSLYVKEVPASMKRSKESIGLEDFNRTMAYNPDLDISKVAGNSGQDRFAAATHFTAGPDGFNISHAATVFRAEEISSGIVEVEVRAGGNNITDAATIATGTYEFSNPTQDDWGGKLIIIELDKEALILPNEDFYLIFRYPLLIVGPQLGVVGPTVETVPFRYMFRLNNTWYDAQTKLTDFLTAGFAHIALEREAKDGGWLKILTNEEGIVKVGESSSLDIEASGKYAVQGEQKALLTFTSNDLEKPVISIPVVLNMNQGPQFKNAPAKVTMAEMETRSFVINVEDAESHNITAIEAVEVTDFVTYSIANDILSITLAPQYGDEGTHTVTFRATDEHGMSNDLVLNIEVTKTNRAPEYISEIKELAYSMQNEEMEYNINDFFADPDGDDFTFTVSAQDEGILSVYSSAGTFRIKPETAGITQLLFTLTDVHGAVATHVLTISVEDCISADVIVQKWNSVLLVNNVKGNYLPDGYQWYKNGQPLEGATKQYYAAGGNGSEELDFNALYFVQMTTTSGKIVYSCNFQPERRDISLKAYPNPVKSGQSLVLEAKLPDLDTNALDIQIINLSGTVVKKQVSKQVNTTIEMPNQPGSYLIKVSSGVLSRTFNIIVE